MAPPVYLSEIVNFIIRCFGRTGKVDMPGKEALVPEGSKGRAAFLRLTIRVKHFTIILVKKRKIKE